MLSASAVLCHPLLQRLTWELPELRLSLFIPGDYKLKIWDGMGRGGEGKFRRHHDKQNVQTSAMHSLLAL